MPTVLRVGPYRFFFYSGDGDEPRHIHVECGEGTAKFWLDPVRLESSGGLNRSEIGSIARLVEDHIEALRQAWDGFFDG